MPEIVIFTGIQASGKSSFYKEHFFQAHVRVSLDLLRTRNREQKLIEYCLATKMSLVIDNTNPSRADRKRYFDFVKEWPQFEVHGYYFQSKVQECVFRNSARAAVEKIPEIAIRSTHAKLEIPQLAEGYKHIWYVSILANSAFKTEPWSSEIW